MSRQAKFKDTLSYSEDEVKHKKVRYIYACLILFALLVVGLWLPNRATAISRPVNPSIRQNSTNSYTVTARYLSVSWTLQSLKWGMSNVSSTACYNNIHGTNSNYKGSIRVRPNVSSYSFTTPNSTAKKYVCVAATYRHGTVAPLETVKQHLKISTAVNTAPRIIISKSNNLYTASATGVKSNTYRYVIKSTSSCSNTDFARAGVSYGTYSRVYTAKSSDNNKYVCFTVQNNSGVWGYKSRKMIYTHTDTTPPSITVRYDNNSNSYSGFTSSTVSNWRHVVVTKTSNCKKDAFLKSDGSYVNDGDRSGKTWKHSSKFYDNKYICFTAQKTSNKKWGYGYRKIQPLVDMSAPQIHISEQDNYYLAHVSNVDIKHSTYRYVIKSTSSCSNTDFARAGVSYGTKSAGYTAKSSDNNKYVCFTVQSNSGVWGYKSRKMIYTHIDTTPPSIIIRYHPSYNSYSVSSSSSDVNNSTWQYVILRPQVVCNSTTFPGNSGIKSRTYTAQPGDVGRQVCFKVSDKSGNWAYEASTTLIKLPVDTTPPPVTISQRGNTITATTTDLTVTAWKYTLQGHPNHNNCTSGRTVSIIGQSIASTRVGNTIQVTYTVRNEDKNHWICIQATDGSGNHGKAYLQMQYRSTLSASPTITITKTGNTYTASATGVKSNTYRYVINSTSSCSNTDFARAGVSYGTYSRVYTATSSDDNNDYVCFTVQSNSGVWGYKSQKIIYTAPPTVGDTDSNNDNPISITVPQVIITKADYRTYVASTDGVTGSVIETTWQGKVMTSASTCNNANAGNILYDLKNRHISDSGDIGKFICFRVQLAGGTTWIYGHKEIDTWDITGPNISFSTNNNILTVTARDDSGIASFRYVAVSGNNFADNDCQTQSSFGNRFDSYTPNLPTTITTSSANLNIQSGWQNYWICVKVMDNLANVSYKAIKLDYNEENPQQVFTTRDMEIVILTERTKGGHTFSAEALRIVDGATTSEDISSHYTWKNIILDDSQTCSSASFNNQAHSGKVRQLTNRQLEGFNQDKQICFRATDSAGDHKIKSQTIAKLPPVVPIIININQEITNSNLVITATPVNINTPLNWQYTIMDNSEVCLLSTFDQPRKIDNGNSLTITSTNKDEYTDKQICFKAYDKITAGFQAAPINLSLFESNTGGTKQAPQIDIDQNLSEDKQSLEIKATVINNVKGRGWLYIITNQETSCNATTFRSLKYIRHAGDSLVIARENQQEYISKNICFRAEANSKYGFKAEPIRVDYFNEFNKEIPDLKITQTKKDKVLEIRATVVNNIPVSEWSFIIVDDVNSIKCDTELFNDNDRVQTGSKFTITESKYGKYSDKKVCFRAVSSLDSSHIGYQESSLAVDRIIPITGALDEGVNIIKILSLVTITGGLILIAHKIAKRRVQKNKVEFY